MKTMLADVGRKKLVVLVVSLVAVGLFFKAAKEKSPTTNEDSNEWDIHIYEDQQTAQRKIRGTTNLQVTYRDLSECEIPAYLPEYKANCWGECRYEKSCDKPPTSEDIAAGRARLVCFENSSLIGVRKAGTTDISRWFKRLDNVFANKNGNPKSIVPSDYYIGKECPMEFFSRKFPDASKISTADRIYQRGPGILLGSHTYDENVTHMVVSPVSQYLGFMSTPDTKFHIQLRHPTERAISYLYQWHRDGKIFKKIPLENFTSDITDHILLGLLRDMEECIKNFGELGCLYQTHGHDWVLPNLLKHSLYVLYIEEAFKFIPQEQFIITTMEDYKKNETQVMMGVLRHFGIEYHHSAFLDEQAEKIENKGKKNPISRRVVKALDDFFMPYNERLAKILNDDKFLYLRH